MLLSAMCYEWKLINVQLMERNNFFDQKEYAFS